MSCSFAWGQSVEWLKQYGTQENDFAQHITTDSFGNYFVSGWTTGNMEGGNRGDGDGFVSKYDSLGVLLWVDQFGSNGFDIASSLAVDATGSLYVAGSTEGGVNHAGGKDAYVRRYDSDGNFLWQRQFGTVLEDTCTDISLDGFGNAYVTGYTRGGIGGSNVGNHDAYIKKISADGFDQWTRSLGTVSADYGYAISSDQYGNVYVSGHTQGRFVEGAMGGNDTFLFKFDSSGDYQWTVELPFSASYALATDLFGNVFMAGTARGDLFGTSVGNGDAYLTKLSGNGDILWGHQIGSMSSDNIYGVSADDWGNVYVAGSTEGSLEGTNPTILSDAFVSQYHSNGSHLWTKQLGSILSDGAISVSVNELGELFATGSTNGNLGGLNAGQFDIFVAKFRTQVPEPSAGSISTALLLALFGSKRFGKQTS